MESGGFHGPKAHNRNWQPWRDSSRLNAINPQLRMDDNSTTEEEKSAVRPSSPVFIDPPTLVYSISNSLGIIASYYKRIARAEQLEEGHPSLLIELKVKAGWSGEISLLLFSSSFFLPRGPRRKGNEGFILQRGSLIGLER